MSERSGKLRSRRKGLDTSEDALRRKRLIRKALREPWRIPPAVIGRIVPASRFGPSWVLRPDGFFTFKVDGFVAAPNPPMLLARHNWEIHYIRHVLTGVVAERSLEIGCGFGRLSPVLAGFSRQHIGVDINTNALVTARLSYPELQFAGSSATLLPFPRSSFDLVTTWTVLQHITPDLISAAVCEIKRVLSGNGRLLICEETRKVGTHGKHTWHRPLEYYAAAFAPMALKYEAYIGEIDRIPGMETPGRVMLFRYE
jgi:SAM-dependent methyltransferase